MLRKMRCRNSFISVVNKGQYPGDLFCSCMNFSDQECYPHKPVPHALPSGPITYCQVGFAGGLTETRLSYARGAESLKWKPATDIIACQIRRTKEFGVVSEGGKEETSTADGIEGLGPGTNGWDLILWEANHGTLDLEGLMGTSPCDLRVPRGCLWLAMNAWSYGFAINGTLCVWNLIWSRGRYMTCVMSCGMVSSCLFEPYMTLNELCHSLFFYKGCTIIYVVF